MRNKRRWSAALRGGGDTLPPSAFSHAGTFLLGMASDLISLRCCSRLPSLSRSLESAVTMAGAPEVSRNCALRASQEGAPAWHTS